MIPGGGGGGSALKQELLLEGAASFLCIASAVLALSLCGFIGVGGVSEMEIAPGPESLPIMGSIGLGRGLRKHRHGVLEIC